MVIGVFPITRSSSSSSVVHGCVSVKRRPAGPCASNTRVSPPFTCSRATRITATKKEKAMAAEALTGIGLM